MRDGPKTAPTAPMRRHGENPSLDGRPRHERKRLLAHEAKLRKSGQWPAWVEHDVPPGVISRTAKGGWASEIRKAYVNGVFSVLVRDAGHGYTHFVISSLSGIRPTWWEAQRIKNDLAGPGATAVEVYPPQNEVVDAADAYHLWVLPAPMPVSIYSGKGY